MNISVLLDYYIGNYNDLSVMIRTIVLIHPVAQRVVSQRVPADNTVLKVTAAVVGVRDLLRVRPVSAPEKRPVSLLSVPYVCPEPVLAK